MSCTYMYDCTPSPHYPMTLHSFFPGEMNHGDVTDEESLDDKNRPDSGQLSNSLTPSLSRPLNKTTSAMTLEMLVSTGVVADTVSVVEKDCNFCALEN